MKSFFLLCILFLVSVNIHAQKFQGKLHYQVLALYDDEAHTVKDSFPITEFICDTAIRIDQKSSLGTQSTIYNINNRVTSVLMDFGGKKIAILIPDSSAITAPVDVKYKYCSKKIAGKKCKKALINSDQPIYYTKSIPAELSTKFHGLKGFPVQYTLNTKDGLIKYTVVQFESIELSSDTFSIPQGYERMTLEAFYSKMGE